MDRLKKDERIASEGLVRAYSYNGTLLHRLGLSRETLHVYFDICCILLSLSVVAIVCGISFPIHPYSSHLYTFRKVAPTWMCPLHSLTVLAFLGKGFPSSECILKFDCRKNSIYARWRWCRSSRGLTDFVSACLALPCPALKPSVERYSFTVFLVTLFPLRFCSVIAFASLPSRRVSLIHEDGDLLHPPPERMSRTESRNWRRTDPVVWLRALRKCKGTSTGASPWKELLLPVPRVRAVQVVLTTV